MSAQGTPVPATPTDDDRLWGMLSWLPVVGWIFAILVLVMEDHRTRAFQRFHAVQALAYTIAVWILITILSLTGIGALISCVISPLLLAYQIYLAFQAYQGQWAEIPGLTPFLRRQGWI